jgi:large subunit ribosomal protein L2
MSQRAGKGSSTYKAKHKGIDTQYIARTAIGDTTMMEGEVTRLIKDTGRNSIVAQVVMENGQKEFVLAAEGLTVGQRIQHGEEADVQIGNVLALSNIPEGCPIFNIERVPGDGGSFVKSTGTYGLVVTKDPKRVFVKLSSGKTVKLSRDSRATIGNVSGGGRKEKPLVKAGTAYHKNKAKHRKYPRVRGVAMNALDHPFGGMQHHAGKSKSTSRTAPPGRKVGAIASKRTGRKKKG